LIDRNHQNPLNVVVVVVVVDDVVLVVDCYQREVVDTLLNVIETMKDEMIG